MQIRVKLKKPSERGNLKLIKYIGITAIFVSCLMYGGYLAGKLSQRIKILTAVVDMLDNFLREMRYSMPVLSDIFKSCTAAELRELTLSLSAELRGDKAFKLSVVDAVRSCDCLDVLTDEEKGSLIKVLSELGTSDIDAQQSVLESGISIFEKYLENAETDKNKNSKVYFTVSVYAGLAAAVMLI